MRLGIMNKWSLIFWRKENSVSCLPASNVLSTECDVGKVYSVKWNRKKYLGQIAGLGECY